MRVKLVPILMLVSAFALLSAPFFTDAQTAGATGVATTTSAEAAQIAALNQQIAQYQVEIQQTGADKATLQTAINKLDLQKSQLQTQVKLTQTKISATQNEIQQLGQSIASDQSNIEASQQALGEDIRVEAEADNEPLVEQVLSSGGMPEVLNDVEDLTQVNSAINDEVQQLQTHQSTLAASKDQTVQAQNALNTQKATLTTQQASITTTTNQKQQLLTETSAQESQYEQLLAQAQAQLNSFSTFSENAPSGSGLLTDQTVCDSWGCYYNQRDAEWGNNSLDGTKYTMKSDGCLVTSMAMVMSHYGATGVTPETINSDPSDFAAYEPAYLLFTISAGGMTATRKTTTIDATLATGNPVIVGLNAYGGTHYVVLVSGSKGNYVMKDPYIPNGNDISFSAHYSMSQIFGISKVVVS